jgi:hypothetical protein
MNRGEGSLAEADQVFPAGAGMNRPIRPPIRAPKSVSRRRGDETGPTGPGARDPQQPLRPRRGLDGRRIVPGKEARLKLASPIGEPGTRQIRVTGQTALDPKLVKLRIIKGAEFPRKSPESPDLPKQEGDEVNNQPEPRLLCECETMFGFAFHLGKRIARREKVRVQLVAAVGGVSEVPDRVCRLKRAAHQIAASPDMARPGQNYQSDYNSFAYSDPKNGEFAQYFNMNPVMPGATHGTTLVGHALHVMSNTPRTDAELEATFNLLKSFSWRDKNHELRMHKAWATFNLSRSTKASRVSGAFGRRSTVRFRY